MNFQEFDKIAKNIRIPDYDKYFNDFFTKVPLSEFQSLKNIYDEIKNNNRYLDNAKQELERVKKATWNSNPDEFRMLWSSEISKNEGYFNSIADFIENCEEQTDFYREENGIAINAQEETPILENISFPPYCYATDSSFWSGLTVNQIFEEILNFVPENDSVDDVKPTTQPTKIQIENILDCILENEMADLFDEAQDYIQDQNELSDIVVNFVESGIPFTENNLKLIERNLEEKDLVGMIWGHAIVDFSKKLQAWNDKQNIESYIIDKKTIVPTNPESTQEIAIVYCENRIAYLQKTIESLENCWNENNQIFNLSPGIS